MTAKTSDVYASTRLAVQESVVAAELLVVPLNPAGLAAYGRPAILRLSRSPAMTTTGKAAKQRQEHFPKPYFRNPVPF